MRRCLTPEANCYPPLAWFRMAAELWLDRLAASINAEIVRNLTETDEPVDEILLASRLDHLSPVIERAEVVDLLGFAAKEAARVNATICTHAGRPRN